MGRSLASLAEIPVSLQLMHHQQAGVAWLSETPRALLADDPGLGKTAQALLAAVPPVLVVAPAMLAGTWATEVAKWRPEWTENDWQWVSYSSLCRRVGHMAFASPREEYLRPWPTVIFDEAHYLKNRKAKWTQAALLLVGKAKRVFMLTGTPVPNWAHELYMPLRIMHPGDTEYRSYWRWIERWFAWWTPPYGATGHREILGLKDGTSWEQFAFGNDLNALMLRRRREDVLADLPPLTETTIEVCMSDAQRRAYRELKEQYYTFIAEASTEVAAFSDGGLHIKLAKATTGLPTLADDPDIEGSCKLDALRELLEEREGAPVVVFCHFRSSALAAERLGRKLGRKVALIMGGVPQTERDRVLVEFQDGEIDLLVGTLDTLGEGITLTRSSTAIFLERSWRPSRNEQAMRRLHRIGQTAPVTVIYIIAADSLDTRMSALLSAKNDQQVSALRAAEFARLL
jgi:SNF2 family DNA or RNA helicase